MSEPLASVCMITYNHKPYIRQAIEGVLRQETDFPYELLIGEDCSTDGTREIVFDYQRQYPQIIRVITSDKNVGARKNSLRTRRACTGKYIAYCEGDDYWQRTDKLQHQIEYLETHPDCGLVYSDYDCHFVALQRTVRNYNQYKSRNLPIEPRIEDFVLGRGGILGGLLTCTVVVRRNLLEQVVRSDPFLHDHSHFLMGDTQKWAEISQSSRIHYMNTSFATHNILEESASRSNDRKKTLKFYLSGSEMLLYLCHKYSLPHEIHRFQEHKWCEYSFELAFLERDLTLAKNVMKRFHRLPLKYIIKYYAMKNRYLYVSLKNALSLRRRFLPVSEGFHP